MAPPKKTLYQILGVPAEASAVEIGLAYEMRMAELEQRVPPDPSGLALVKQAHEVLSNPNRRAAYDSQLLTASEKAAAERQGTTDLEIGEEPAPRPKAMIAGVAVAALAIVVALYLALRPTPAPPPAPVAAAPKPVAPPPPKPRNAMEVLADAATSAGALLVYSMSGAATPIGMAVSTDAGSMVTTCHGIPAGGKLIVSVGKEQHPADLTITDEALGLCRLSVAGFTTPPLRLSTDEPKEGDRIVLVGLDPKGALATAEGTVKGIRKTPAGNMIEITTPVGANTSGAGVFDQFGKLIGIATTPHDQGSNVHLAIPASSISQMRSRTK